MPPVGFEPAIPASKRPQTYALDRPGKGIGTVLIRDIQLKYRLRLIKNHAVNKWTSGGVTPCNFHSGTRRR
jgi:hypothetical protein